MWAPQISQDANTTLTDSKQLCRVTTTTTPSPLKSSRLSKSFDQPASQTNHEYLKGPAVSFDDKNGVLRKIKTKTENKACVSMPKIMSKTPNEPEIAACKKLQQLPANTGLTKVSPNHNTGHHCQHPKASVQKINPERSKFDSVVNVSGCKDVLKQRRRRRRGCDRGLYIPVRFNTGIRILGVLGLFCCLPC